MLAEHQDAHAPIPLYLEMQTVESIRLVEHVHLLQAIIRMIQEQAEHVSDLAIRTEVTTTTMVLAEHAQLGQIIITIQMAV
ncbi:hypothetical protein D3C85_1489750 [compost metagenome]